MYRRISYSLRSTWPLGILASLLAVVMIVVPGRSLFGEDDVPKGAADSRDIRTSEMRQIVESMSAFRGQSPDKQPLRLRHEPLLRFNDPTRKFSDASLWAWTDTGRPVAIVALELYPMTEGGTPLSSWAFEFISLATEPLEFRAGGDLSANDQDKFNQVVDGRIYWAPRRPGVAFEEIPKAPAPAKKAPLRLAQMKDLVKRFGATERHGNNDSIVLRLLPHPIDRYTDEKAGVVDGAIFVFATGTNPEALLLIEARGPTPEKALWHFATARVTAAPYEITLDRKAVGGESGASGQRIPGEAYNTTRLTRKKPL